METTKGKSKKGAALIAKNKAMTAEEKKKVKAKAILTRKDNIREKEKEFEAIRNDIVSKGKNTAEKLMALAYSYNRLNKKEQKNLLNVIYILEKMK